MKKFQNLFSKTQDGRSMVEMLGVLAIIGVLSVGGIAGFNMAMLRYRTNELLDTINKMSVLSQQVYEATKGIQNEVDYKNIYGKPPSQGLPNIIGGTDYLYVQYLPNQSKGGEGCYMAAFKSLLDTRVCDMAIQIAGADRLQVEYCEEYGYGIFFIGDCENIP